MAPDNGCRRAARERESGRTGALNPYRQKSRRVSSERAAGIGAQARYAPAASERRQPSQRFTNKPMFCATNRHRPR
jgi:hypothetical protein